MQRKKRTEKKTAGCISAVLLLTAVFPSAAVADSLAGTVWYACPYNIPVCISFQDGTYTRTIDGREEDGTWELDGETLVLDPGEDHEMSFAFDGTELLSAVGETEYRFTQEPATGFRPAVIRVGAVMTDFEGTWTAYKTVAENIIADPDVTGISSLTVTVYRGRLSLFMESDTADVTLEDIILQYKNGTMSFVFDLTGGGQGSGTVCVLEDGTMYLSMVSGDAAAGFFLKK